jgi:hypothetical protein
LEPLADEGNCHAFDKVGLGEELGELVNRNPRNTKSESEEGDCAA